MNDKASNIAIDNLGNIIVTGESETAPNVFEYLTVKYVEKQVITPTDFNSETPPYSFSYYSNRGQLINTSGSPVPDIKYYTTNSSPALYINENSSSFVFAHIDTIPSTLDTLQRIDLTFDKVNAAAKTYPMEEHSDFRNYFLAQCSNGITRVHGNQRLITTDLYPNIDLMYSSNQNGIKYYYIIKPGGTPTNIHLIYTGATSFNLNGSTNVLTINSSVGNISFERPTVYQLDASNNITPITGWTADWQTNGASNLYKFNIGAYDNTKPLIIQVDRGHSTQQITQNGNLEWSTFYGGTNWDEFNDVSTDAFGNIYASGDTYDNYFPVLAGFFMSGDNGSDNGVIAKFDSSAVLKWATYYGGSSNDYVQNNCTDNIGYLYIAGYTNSNNMPVFNNPPHINYFDSTYNGGNDLFIAKLETTYGTPVWSTYYGGAHNENISNMVIDSQHNLYISGMGDSLTPLKIKNGAYNDSIGTGLILRFNNNDSLIWATLYGENSSVNIQGIESDASRSIYITGNTGNNGIPIVNLGGYIDSTYNGGYNDIFIAKFNNNDSLIWSTYYGSSYLDKANALTIDNNNDVIITGNTNSNGSSFPYYYAGGNSFIDSTNTNVTELFILKFNSKGVRLWASLHDGTISPRLDITHDSDNKIYITGGIIFNNFPTKQWSNAYYQSSTSGNDAFILAFTGSDSLFWATYFGGYDSDYGAGITTYKNQKLYLVGNTHSSNTSFPLAHLSNACWQPNNAGGDDCFISRFGLLPISNVNIADINTNKYNISVFPNPASEKIYVDFGENKVTNINLFTINGSLIYKDSIKNQKTKEIDISSLPTGVYFLQIIADSFITTKKFIKY